METQPTFTPHGAPIHAANLLPVQPPEQVIGRNRELGSMHVTLKVGSSVFLSGPSGIGKTALASVLATAFTASNPGGVLWFNVIEDDLTLLLARVGRAYGVNALTFTENTEDEVSNNIEIVRALLEKNRPLIVLDGLIDIDATRDFVKQCAVSVPIIITNELPGAGPWTPINLEPLSAADSQTLFSFYSGLTDALFQADIEGLCKFLGGLPLAIELAGRQMVADNQTPAELLTTLPSSAGLDSHYMMMAVIFKRLPSSIQAMLLVLAAMPTGIATAELIGDLSNVPPARVIPLMRQLVGRALVREFVSYGQYAYYLHESIQSYVRTWLQQYQRLQITENRALQAVLSYVERHAHNNAADHDRLAAEIDNIVGAAAFATDTSQTNALRQLINALTQEAGDFVTLRGFQPELGQIRKLATLLPDFAARSTGTHPTTSTAEIVKKRTTGSLRPISTTTPPPDAIASAARRTEQARIPEPPADTQATPAVQRLPLVPKPPLPEESGDAAPGDQTQPAPASPEMLPGAQSLEQTGPNFSTDALKPVVVQPEADLASPPSPADSVIPVPSLESAPAEAAVPTTEATPLADRVDARSLIEAEAVIVEPPISPEDTETPTDLSLPTVQKQLEDARAADDLDAQAPLLQTLGQFYADRGNRPEALTHYKEALEIYEVIEDNDGMLASLDALAAIAAQADDVENALVYATRGVNLAQQIGDKDRLGRLQTRLGDVRLAVSDAQAAIDTYTQAAETLRGIDNWTGVGTVMLKMGEAYLEKGQPQEAILMLEQALVIFRKEGLGDYESRALGTLGDVYGEMGQWAKAQEYHEQALTLTRTLADPFEEAAHLAALAHIREIQNDRPAAVNFHRQALHVAYMTGDVDLQAENAFELGRLLIDDTRTLMQAAQLLRESDSLVPNSEARRLLSRANKRLERTTAAGITLPPAEGTNQEYAAAGYTQTQGAMSGSSAPR